MIKEIIKFISNVNISYIILSLLFLIVSLLFLRKKNANSLVKEYYIIMYVSIAWIILFFTNDILNQIFKLNYLSVKLYLLLLIIGNIIMLITINKDIKKEYKRINITLFISNIIILILNIITIIGNKASYFATTTLKDCVKLMNINYIIFIFYLITLCLTYITLEIKNIINSKKELNKLVIEKPNIKEVIEEKNTELSIPTKLKYHRQDEEGFFIDGVNCSIIFEDENKENVIKNYYILLNDINAKLVNGYTLKENIKIKDIINKLNIKDLNNINIDVNQLNKITIDEYNLLKRYLSSINNY